MTPPRFLPTTSPRAGRRAALALLAGTLLTAPAFAAGRPGLIPPPGPWPAPVAGAVNPLAGTAYAANGGQATANASLRVWLPVRHKHRAAITRTIGRHTIVAGHLRNRDTHHSISGATITLVTQSVYGGDWVAVANFRTNRKGHFRALLPPGPSRRTAVLYWPAVDSPAPVVSRRLLVRARTRVWLGKPHHNGRSYRFDGKVSGAPVPPTGLLIALQVRNQHGTWVSPRFASTRPSGRFSVRYRFPAPGRFAVRIRVPFQTGWSLYGAYSHTQTISP